MERNEGSIDLSRLFHIICERKAIVFAVVGGFTLVALVMSFVLPKEYESTTLVHTRGIFWYSCCTCYAKWRKYLLACYELY